MIYHSIQDLLNLAKEYQIPLWEVVCRADMEERQVTKEQSFETMHRMYEAMKQADSAYDKDLKSASAMAAAGLAYLQGGDDEQIVNAMAFALKNMLGLTCDPVCGLVEVPCIKRNSAGAVNAVTSAQMALAGICSAIAPDEVIDTMRRIGNALPACLKETSEGGLATTPSAQKVREKMDGGQ
mgnify:CR=1 FL=1